MALLRKRLSSMIPPHRACSPWLEALAKMFPRATSLSLRAWM